MKNRSAAAASGMTLCWMLVATSGVEAETLPARGAVDSRVRVAAYDAQQVYRLTGYVGYQIDLQFEPGETFVGLGAGDLDALAFVARDNHLFLKPRVARANTNLTVLTNRRSYLFDYSVVAGQPHQMDREAIYALRFTYPPVPGETEAEIVTNELNGEPAKRAVNVDYWYCGHPSLQPVAASDDGVHTRLRFAANAELPAIFVGNEDGSESLLNFNIHEGEVIIHRLARRFILRRGRLTGCVVNKGFQGDGNRLDSGTVAPDVQRSTREVSP